MKKLLIIALIVAATSGFAQTNTNTVVLTSTNGHPQLHMGTNRPGMGPRDGRGMQNRGQQKGPMNGQRRGPGPNRGTN